MDNENSLLQHKDRFIKKLDKAGVKVYSAPTYQQLAADLTIKVDLMFEASQKQHFVKIVTLDDKYDLSKLCLAIADVTLIAYSHDTHRLAKSILLLNRPLIQESHDVVEYLEQKPPRVRLLWWEDNELHASPQTREELAFLWP